MRRFPNVGDLKAEHEQRHEIHIWLLKVISLSDAFSEASLSLMAIVNKRL